MSMEHPGVVAGSSVSRETATSDREQGHGDCRVVVAEGG
jgi:hypothetical protein